MFHRIRIKHGHNITMCINKNPIEHKKQHQIPWHIH